MSSLITITVQKHSSTEIKCRYKKSEQEVKVVNNTEAEIKIFLEPRRSKDHNSTPIKNIYFDFDEKTLKQVAAVTIEKVQNREP